MIESTEGTPTQLAVPFSLDPAGNIAEQTEPTKMVGDRLRALVSTQPGSRVMQPEYGVDLDGRLFYDTDAAAVAITADISDAVAKWEPEAVINSLSANPDTITGEANVELDFSKTPTASFQPRQKAKFNAAPRAQVNPVTLPSGVVSFPIPVPPPAGPPDPTPDPTPTSADTESPSVPANFISTAQTSASADLSWDASTDNVGVVLYTVYNNGGIVATTVPPDTNVTISGLAPSTAYSFTVRAKDAAGNESANSATLNVTTSATAGDTTPPTAPTGLISSARTDTTVSLAWNASTDDTAVTGYTVYRSGIAVKTATGLTAVVSGLTGSTAYTFTVRAKDAAGNESADSTALTVITQPPVSTTLVGKIPTISAEFHGMNGMYWSLGSDSLGPNSKFFTNLDVLAANGVQILRVDTSWSAMEPTRGVFSATNFWVKRQDLVISEAAKRGMRVYFTLWITPSWIRPAARAGDNNSAARVAAGKVFPTDPTTFTGICKWLAARYAGNSTVVGWEIWNEPNLIEFTDITDATQRAVKYVPVLKNAYAAFKSVDPNAKIVFGGPSLTDDTFISVCYSNGVKGSYDVMAFHPYMGNQTYSPDSPDLNPPTKGRVMHFPVLLTLLRNNGDGNTPIWWTEFGYSVHPNTPADDGNGNIVAPDTARLGVPTTAVQSQYYQTEFNLARTLAGWEQIRLATMYCAWKPGDDAYNEGRHQHGFRLIEDDGVTARPVLAAIKALGTQYGQRAIY